MKSWKPCLPYRERKHCMATTQTATLEAALALAERGFFVVPLCVPVAPGRCSHAHLDGHKGEHHIGKTPFLSGGYNRAARTRAAIKADWKNAADANIGIAVGEKYGLFSLEVDMHEADGEASLEALQEADGPLPETVEALSGNGRGGRHFYFRWPAGVDIRSQQVIGSPGLEIKADGGMCAPPSLHVSGLNYKWVSDPDTEIAEAPEWLLHLIATPGSVVRPKIIIGKQLRDTTSQALDALEDAERGHPTIFVQPGQLVRVSKDRERRPVLTPMSVAEMKYAMTNAANFYKTRKIPNTNDVELLPVSPPNEVAEQLLSLPPIEWPFPVLDAIIEIPVIRPDGSILDRAGYDAKTHLYYMPAGLSVPAIPAHPSSEEVKTAAAYIDEFIGEFPYVSQADHANAYGFFLTPFIRHLIRHVPAAVISANKPGTGKGLMVDTAATTATGHTAANLSEIKNEEEWDKRITALLMAGTTFISIDNVDGVLRSSILAKTLTSDTHKGRVLKESRMIDTPQHATWVITGNNVQLGGDMPRRCYFINLASQVSNPWTRDGFKHPDLIKDVTNDLGKIIAAMLTMIRGWIAAGKPSPRKKLTRLATFSEWVDLIGGILAYAGIDGFLDNLQEMYEQTDIDGNAWTLFLETWLAKLGEQPYTTSQLIA